MNNRILIVDDNPDIHADFRKILTPDATATKMSLADEAFFGGPVGPAPSTIYQLTSAYQGLQAIQIVRDASLAHLPFALAFVDVRMPPGIDGVQTIKELWQIDPDLEVVISTAYSDYSWDQLRATLQQADWLLILKKPFDNIEVLQLTKALTRKWRLEREYQLQLTSLRRSNAMLHAQQETSIDGILVIDETRKILAYNGQFIKLWGISQTITQTNDDNLILSCIAANLTEPLSFYQRLKHLYEHPSESSRDEVTLLDGRIIDRYSTPITGERGQDFGRIWYFRDITREREFENQLRHARDAADQANRSKSIFLANMSHEIRTPMTAILGYADLLAQKRRHLSQVQQDEYIATIKRNGEHLLSIINDILDISKIESGKMGVESLPVSPIDILQDVLSLMAPGAQAKNLTLQPAFDTPIPLKVLSDPLRLKQILVNILSNAIKFTHQGSVTVTVSHIPVDPVTAGPTLSFCIHDTGIGMSPEQCSRLFGAFEQADTSTTRLFGGTGLGLRISKRLAQLLSGDITVVTQPGKGSAFSLTIPTGPLDGVEMLSPQAATERISSPRPAPPLEDLGTPLAGMRILLAEDGQDTQRLLNYFLSDAGAHVQSVTNGEELIKALTIDGTLTGTLKSPAPVHLLLTDMQMPVMDGYAAVALLRAKACALPIIALSARAMTGESDECFVAGCNDYAAKPIDQPALIALCRKWGTPAPPSDHPAGPPLQSLYARQARMAGIVYLFVSELPRKVDLIRTFLAASQLSELQTIAHQLAGSAGSYGFPTITQAAQELDSRIRNHAPLPDITASANSLIDLCTRATAT